MRPATIILGINRWIELTENMDRSDRREAATVLGFDSWTSCRANLIDLTKRIASVTTNAADRELMNKMHDDPSMAGVVFNEALDDRLRDFDNLGASIFGRTPGYRM